MIFKNTEKNVVYLSLIEDTGEIQCIGVVSRSLSNHFGAVIKNGDETIAYLKDDEEISLDETQTHYYENGETYRKKEISFTCSHLIDDNLIKVSQGDEVEISNISDSVLSAKLIKKDLNNQDYFQEKEIIIDQSRSIKISEIDKCIVRLSLDHPKYFKKTITIRFS